MENEFFEKDLRIPLKKEKRRVRVMAILLTGCILLSLLFLVFAFLQKIDADAARTRLKVAQQELEQCQGK